MFHALIVGINEYADEKIKNLEYARADAEQLAEILSERVEGGRQVTLLVDDRATKSRIARVLTEQLPREVTEEDDVLVFFAGHGSPEVDASCGEPSIHAVTHDTQYAQLGSTGINMVSELSAWIRRLNARHTAVVVDASFNGAAGGRTFEGPGLWSGPRTRRLDRISLHRLALGSQGAILTSCSDKEAANEEPRYRHGVFSYHLLNHLQQAPAGPLSLGGIYDSVVGAVREATGGSQNPALHAIRSGQLLFRLGGQPSAPPPPPLVPAPAAV